MPITNYSRSMYLSAVGNVRLRNAIKACSPNMNSAEDLAGQTVNNSAVLVNETNLVLPVVANKFYCLEGFLPLSIAAAANNISLDLNGGTCAVSNMAGTFFFTAHNTATTLAYDTSALNTLIVGGITVAWTKCWINVSFLCTQSGSLQLRFAQNVAAANNTQIQAGAWLTAYPLDHVIEE